MTIRAVRGDKFLRMADFRGPTFAYRLPLWRDVRNAVFPSFPDAPGAKNVFVTLQVWVRDPAARYARVVCERFAPKEIRGRGECRVPVAPAASRADLGFQHCAADLLFEYYRQFEQLQRFRRGRQRC